MGVISRRPRRATGRFVLRIPPGLHATLRRAAREVGVSLNEYCARKLAAPQGGLASVGEAASVVARAGALFGDDLIALAAFGSLARGEATNTSDVDVLIVVEERVELTRELYRKWDAAPLLWADRPVDAHFAHLPEPGVRVAGVWGELAIDGIILFERDLRLSQRLAEVRRDIAAGRILRRTAHGQPYWTEVA
jgi:predicted nucleotidyltransferase